MPKNPKSIRSNRETKAQIFRNSTLVKYTNNPTQVKLFAMITEESNVNICQFCYSLCRITMITHNPRLGRKNKSFEIFHDDFPIHSGR